MDSLIDKDNLLSTVELIFENNTNLNSAMHATMVEIKKRLKCDSVALFTLEDGIINTQEEFHIYEGDSFYNWSTIKNRLKKLLDYNYNVNTNNTMFHFYASQHSVYCFFIASYGYVVFTRKTAFLVNFLSKLSVLLDDIEKLVLNFHSEKDLSNANIHAVTHNLNPIFKDVLENSKESVLIATLDGTLCYANAVSKEWLGLEEDQLKHIKAYDFEHFVKGDKLKNWKNLVKELEEVSFKEGNGLLTNFKTGEIIHTTGTLKYVSQGNQDFIVALIKEVAQHDALEAKLTKKTELQDILLRMASTYINVDVSNIACVINQSLQEIGRFVNADRVYVFEYDFEKQTTSNTFEWCEAGIEAEIENLQETPISFIPDWVERHQQKKSFIANNVSELPYTGPYCLRAILEPQGVQSIITLPMFNKNELVGFIGFDSVKKKHYYSESEEKLLQVYAEILLNMQLREQFESELFHQKERFQNIISSIDLGLVELDSDFNISFTNKSLLKFYGYQEIEILGLNAFDVFLNEEDWKSLKQKMYAMQIKDVLIEELQTKDSKGALIPTLCSIVKYKSGENSLGYLSAVVDLTKQKKLEKELRDAVEKAERSMSYKEKFFSNVSHELRTPLNIISGSVTEVIKQEIPKDAHFLINQANIASRHMLSLVNNILEFAKINEGAVKYELKNFNLRTTAEDVFNIFKLMTNDKDLIYELNIHDDIHDYVIGDFGKISQILINFLGNAIKFTNEGRISLEVQLLDGNAHSQRVCFTIKDTGIGMSADFLNRIFDEYQKDDSVENLNTGTGLGMTISKRLIDFMGGDVVVESEKNKGTTVRFSLTLEKREAPLYTNKSMFKNKVILIAEDNYMNAVVLERKILDLGAGVVKVENGELAVQALKNQHFDLVFMDVQMPILDGFGATKIIRETLNLKTPIIAITANVFKKSMDDYTLYGFDDVILKPFEDQVLFAKTSNFLNPNKSEAKHEGNRDIDFSSLVAKEYRLDNLKNLSRGDHKFYKRMLTVFEGIANTAIKELERAITENNIGAIAKAIHKIKPSIKDLEVKSVLSLIEVLETSEYKDANFVLVNTKALLKTLKKVSANFTKNELTN